MKRYLIIPAVVLCLLLGGCGWMDGSYLSITPHQGQNTGVQAKERTASNYLELRTTLEDMVDSGVESAVINVSGYREDLVNQGIANAVASAMQRYPLGAYAVDNITYEVGTNGGRPAISVNITYIHGRSEIRTIENAADMDEVKTLVTAALERCDSNMVAWVKF